ncbi:MAG: cupredoxin domain-containing protein [Bacteroidetes bacterium]|nr:cupredoxin domain-containing protein [Bacteroidota bacterium]
MSRSYFFRSLLLIAVLAIGFISCTPTERDNSEEKGAGVPQQQEYTIEIKQMKFIPAEIIVHKGDKITFVNHDLVTHDITDDPGKTWTSSALPADESWSMTVTQSSNYYCTLHPTMKGKIAVE